MGSQTGDSLYGPSSAQSLVTLRGTDGLESGTGVMPLSWLTDFGGAMARSVSDLADMLNVVVGDRSRTIRKRRRPAGASPADWRSVLDPNALRGQADRLHPVECGSIRSGPPNTTDAEKAALQYLVAAGATIVEMGVDRRRHRHAARAGRADAGDIRAEGWRHYIDSHPELATQGFAIFTEVDVNCSQRKVAYVRADPSTCPAAPPPRLTPAEIQALRDYRRGRQATAKTWMDTRAPTTRRRRRRLPRAAERHQPERRRRQQGELRPPRHAGRGERHSDGRLPRRLQRPRTADQHPAAGTRVGRRQARGMAYAFEEVANAAGNGHVEATTAPALPHDNRKK